MARRKPGHSSGRDFSDRHRVAHYAAAACACGSAITIHDTPKRSATPPKRGEKKVLPIGISTLPPSESALKTRSASAAVGTDIVSETPLKFGLPEHMPSEIISVASPIL